MERNNDIIKRAMIDSAFGKVPPQAIDIESAILGCCMVYPDSVFELKLTPDMFYKDAHKKIFTAILETAKRGGCDILTVTEELRRTNDLDNVGGVLYITQLTANIISDQMIEQHSLIIREKYIKREYIRISAELQNISFDNFVPLDEVVDYVESELFKLSDMTQMRETEKLSRIIDRQITEIEQVYKKEKKLTGVPSGFSNIDRSTGGWQEENLIIIASRPSMGKTALALTLSMNAARMNQPVGLFSLEMSQKEIATRILSTASGYTNVEIRNAEIDLEKLVKDSWEVSELPLWIDDTAAISLYELRSKVKKMVVRHGIKLVIIDYLQLMKGLGDSREQEVSGISRGLKAISKEFHIPVIALSQLNRKCEERRDKRPMLSDLRESGSIEQDADVVAMLWRPAYYNITSVMIENCEESSEGVLFVDIAKNRNGATGDYILYHNTSLTKISDEKL